MLRREQVAREHKEVRVLADLNGSLVGLDEIPSVPCANLIIHLFLSLSRGVARISTPPLSLPACFRDGTGLLYKKIRRMIDPMNTLFAETLRNLRTKKGLSQNQLASLMHPLSAKPL